jgi:predicted phosphate transport protein (TIGR00153 family)
MFGKKKNKSNYYYDSFPALCHYSVECGEYILKFMQEFDHSKLLETKENVHKIEHAADDKKHEVTEKLMEEFMTPIDREDIVSLLRMIDDVTDAIEEISLKLYLYDYKELPPDTIPFMELTLNCIKKTEECLKHFPDFMDVKVMKPLIQDVIHLEEDSDTEYIDDTHTLYLTETDGFKRHKAEAMYSMLEETSDKCREVCKFVETIIYKNL